MIASDVLYSIRNPHVVCVIWSMVIKNVIVSEVPLRQSPDNVDLTKQNYRHYSTSLPWVKNVEFC